MILSCIIHVLMVENLTVNLPMSIKVECAHYCGKSTENSFLVGVVCNVHNFDICFYQGCSNRKTYNKLVKKREDFTSFATDVRLDYFFHMFTCMFIILKI